MYRDICICGETFCFSCYQTWKKYDNGSTSDEDERAIFVTQQNGTLNTGEDSSKAGGLQDEGWAVHRSADGVRCYKQTSSSAKRRASEIVQGCLKEEDITCKVRKQEYEENEGEGEMSETKEEENKIVMSTKNTNIVTNYR